MRTDNVYSSLMYDSCYRESDTDLTPNDEVKVEVRNIKPDLSLQEISSDLAKALDESKISKFKICRNDIREGKKGVCRKSLSPINEVSIQSSDDYGRSEGTVDMGGPKRDFFTLVVE